MAVRRTKIVATLGPATERPETLDAVLAAGRRLRAHQLLARDGGRPARPLRRPPAPPPTAPTGRSASSSTSRVPSCACRAHTEARTVVRRRGGHLRRHRAGRRPGDVQVDFPDFADLVTERSQIVIGDGLPRFAVESIEDGRVHARALSRRRALLAQGLQRHLRAAQPARADREGHRRPRARRRVRGGLRGAAASSAPPPTSPTCATGCARHGSRARTIAKIEKVEAYEHLDEILAVADGDHGRARGLRRRGRRRARAADAEGRDLPRHPGRQDA